MISDNFFTSYGRVETTSKDSSRKAVIEFLDKHLPDFPNFLRVKKRNIAEVRISQVLCPFLNTSREIDEVSLFEFEREAMNEDSQHSSDFAVIDVKEFKKSPFPLKPLFTIEAKRLPTIGRDKDGNSREKEYVEGKLGGIERFKRNLHGRNLPQSAMIGYVQKETCSHWHSKINEWINELISNNSDFWDSEDLLIETNDFSTTKKYASQNTRIVDSNRDKIILYHYLMELI